MTWTRLKALIATEPFWARLELERNPAVLGELAFSTPAFGRLFELIDLLGDHSGREFPLSTAVRYLMMMPLCHRKVLAHFADQLLTDEPIRQLVLGRTSNLVSARVGASEPPTAKRISSYIHQYLNALVPVLEAFYYELVRLYLRKYPDLRLAISFDGSKTDTHGHPERPVYKTDPETGERKQVGVKEATDPDAARWTMRIHNPSRLAKQDAKEARERKKNGFGFHFCHIRAAKKGPPLVLELCPPRKGNGEPNVLLRLLTKMHVIYPEMRIKNGEIAFFIADTGLESKRLTRRLYELGYHAIIPTKRTVARKLLKLERFVTHGVTLRVRRDGGLVCSQGVLKVLPSDLGRQPASRFRCPMTLNGECPSPCALEPRKDASGRIRHPIVKRSIRSLKGGADLFRYPLIPRPGKQFRWLFNLRTANERDYSYVKGRGCFDDLPIRGEKNHALRLLCDLIVLTTLALLKDGIDLPADIADRAWPLATVLVDHDVRTATAAVDLDEAGDEDELDDGNELLVDDGGSEDDPSGDVGEAA